MLLEFSMTHLLWTYFNGADSLYKIVKELHQLEVRTLYCGLTQVASHY